MAHYPATRRTGSLTEPLAGRPVTYSLDTSLQEVGSSAGSKGTLVGAKFRDSVTHNGIMASLCLNRANEGNTHVTSQSRDLGSRIH
jgi:hypothetical protein